MQCFVKADGHLRDCTVIREIPAGMDFATATLKLAPIFVMRPTIPSGQKVEGAEVTIPIAWRLMLPTVGTANWAATPTQDDVIAAFPTDIAGKYDHLSVSILCQIQRGGSLAACVPDGNNPPTGANKDVFALEDAALTLTGKFQVDPGQARTLPSPTEFKFTIQLAAKDSAVWKTRPMGNVVWLAAPDKAMMRSVFPAGAVQHGVTSGSAVVDCIVASTGELTGRSLESESPAQLGFGEAGVQLATHFRMSPWTETGIPAQGARVRLPLNFAR
jgi:hypothetical protein